MLCILEEEVKRLEDRIQVMEHHHSLQLHEHVNYFELIIRRKKEYNLLQVNDLIYCLILGIISEEEMIPPKIINDLKSDMEVS
jgi:hypothetical protein